MRIKRLKARNFQGGRKWYGRKKLDVSLSSTDNIIFVFEPYNEEFFPFCSSDFLDITGLLFFNDSYTTAKAAMRKNTLLESVVERKGVEYTFGIKGDCSEKEKDGFVRMRNVVDWYCIIPEKQLQGENGDWFGVQLCYDAQEYFYPKGLEDVAFFKKDAFADSPTEFVYWGEFGELKRTAKYNKLDVDLEKKLQEIINECSEIRLDERMSVRLNEEKEYVFYCYGEEVTAQENLELVNFCGWINNLNILKRLYELVGEEGDFPIFIESDFDGNLGQYKEGLIKKLRETGRQVFIVSQKRDEGLEKLCDKVLVLN